MNCNDVDKALSLALPLPILAQEHAKSCLRCERLVSAMNMPAPAGAPSPKVLRDIAEGMAADLTPVRPIVPAHYLFGAFIVIFLIVAGLGVFLVGASAIAVMTPLQTATILSALAISTAFLADSLVKQMIPGSRHRILPARLAIGIPLGLALVFTVLFQFQPETDFWSKSWSCVQMGVVLGVVAGGAFWMVLRRGAILSPVMTGAATGLLGGIVGTSALEIHCPNLDLLHLLTAHLGVAILCALAGLLIGLAVDIKVRRNGQEMDPPSLSVDTIAKL